MICKSAVSPDECWTQAFSQREVPKQISARIISVKFLPILIFTSLFIDSPSDTFFAGHFPILNLVVRQPTVVSGGTAFYCVKFPIQFFSTSSWRRLSLYRILFGSPIQLWASEVDEDTSNPIATWTGQGLCFASRQYIVVSNIRPQVLFPRRFDYSQRCFNPTPRFSPKVLCFTLL